MPATPTFEEMFGVGKVPIASYFNPPKGASADTRYTPEARALLGQGEEYAREQAARDAEIAAEELLGGAAGMSDEQLQQQLTQNPRLFGTQAIQPLSGYMKFRQSTSPVSDETLGPILREKITDPYHRERFQQRMLDEGLSATDAFDAYRTDEYNNKFGVALAEAGVPETEYAKLMTPSGKFDPVAVPRAIAQARAAVKLAGTGKKVEPVDEEIAFLENAMEQRKKIFEATGRADKLGEDPLMTDFIKRYEKAAGEKLASLRKAPVINPANQPGPDGVIKRVAPGVARPPVTPAPAIDDDPDIVPEERPRLKQEAAAQTEKAKAQAEEAKAQAKKEQLIASAWTDKKSTLQKELAKVYGEKDLLAVAKGILRNATIPPPAGEPVAYGARPTPIIYKEAVARKLGRNLAEPAFTEPENSRWGTNVVNYAELLQEWADQYASENGGQKVSSMPTSDNSEPLTELIPP